MVVLHVEWRSQKELKAGESLEEEGCSTKDGWMSLKRSGGGNWQIKLVNEIFFMGAYSCGYMTSRRLVLVDGSIENTRDFYFFNIFDSGRLTLIEYSRILLYKYSSGQSPPFFFIRVSFNS